MDQKTRDSLVERFKKTQTFLGRFTRPREWWEVENPDWQEHEFVRQQEPAPTPQARKAAEKLQLSAERRKIVDPILRQKRLSVYRWEELSGVAKGVGQRYLDGATPKKEQAEKLASVLGLTMLP